MEVEDTDIRKPRGRRSRNNSSNSKDPKTEIMKGTNGNAEEKDSEVNDLPNGDDAAAERVRSDENSEDCVEEKEKNSKGNSSSGEVEGAKDGVSAVESANGDNENHVRSGSKRGRSGNATDSDEDFMGFESNEESGKESRFSFLQSLIGKYETDGVLSDDDLTEEEKEFFQRSQENSSDAYWSGTSSPTKIDGWADALQTEELCSSNASSPSVASGFSGEAKPRGKKSYHADLSNPAYRKPLEMGWRRELVFRKMSDQSQKRLADVYYYTPSGKKVRSAREVAEHLSGTDLTDENFTFFKMALGLNDPTKEIIRDAKLRESSGTPPQKMQKLSKAAKVDGTPKTLGVKEDPSGSPKAPKNFSRGAFPRIKVTPVRSNQQQSPNRPRAIGRPKKDSLALTTEGELEIGMLPPSWKEPTAVSGARKATPPTTPVSGKTHGLQGSSRQPAKTPTAGPYAGGQKKGLREPLPCSIRCLSMMGVIPSLQCRLCLCLYHPECVGLGTLTDVIHSYVCKSGLLLVPVAPPASHHHHHHPAPPAALAPAALPHADPVHAQPQYVLVNAHTGGVVFSNFARAREDGYVGVPVSAENNFMQYFMQNVSVGYTALHHVFQYLKVHELLRAGRVCRMWHDLAGHPTLWKTVRMKNSQVLDWDGCAAALSKQGTQHLDLRKMLLDPSRTQEVWNQFCTAIGQISSLHHLDLCRCPSSVVERVAAQCPQLTNLTALFLSDSNLDLKSLKFLTQIEELRLKGIAVNGLKLKSPLDVLTKMTTLRHLSLTTIKDLGKANPETLKSLTQLESLELGECNDFNEAFGSECLPCLKKLTRLRLETGQMKCPTFVILNGLHTLPLLTHLELVNFDIKPGFDKALAQCTNIKRLLLIPTYLTQSATTNHMVLGGVTKLSESLVQFVWGVTHELLHVTELFVDQCEGQKGGAPKGAPVGPGGDGGGKNPLQQLPSGKKSGTSDSIPILRPVPGRDVLGAGNDVKPEEDDTSKPSPQVDILPLSQLQKLLATSLPNTKVSILKIPFNATWRQTLGETSH
ncbi:Uncharacterized protein GBIM_14349 [Gryllus bimaculatus]|nr:Uncharacterized protein GBIM_14349 [Gryllus bimaculatus]